MNRYLHTSIVCFTIAIIAFLFIGCSGGSDESKSTATYTGPDWIYDNKITDWQIREVDAPEIVTACSYTGNIAWDIIEIINQLPYITPAPEPSGIDYWKTSEETLGSLSGDCEDMAALAYRALTDSCLPDNYKVDIRIRILDDTGETDHTVTIVYFGAKTFEINNLIFTKESHLPTIVEFDNEFIF